MLRNFFVLSLCVHLFFGAMLLLCPVGIQVGAVRGNGVAFEVVTAPKEASRVSHTSHSKTRGLRATNEAQDRAEIKNPSLPPESSSATDSQSHPSNSADPSARQTLLTGPEPQGPGFDLRNLKSSLSPAMQAYFLALRSSIERSKTYPSLAKRFKQTGQVAVRFEILKSGEIRNIQLEKPSPYVSLNESALSVIEKLKSQLYPLPEEVASSGIEVILPINYHL